MRRLRCRQTCFHTSGNRIGEIWPNFWMFLKKNYGYLHCPHLLGAEFLLAKVNPSCFFFFSLKEKLKARSLKIWTAKLTNPTWETSVRALNILKDRTWSFLEIGSCLCSIHLCPENRSRLVVNGSNRLKLNKKLVNANQTWVVFINCFAPYAYLSRLSIFCIIINSCSLV